MTEASFQEARKVMQSANYQRGIITKWVRRKQSRPMNPPPAPKRESFNSKKSFFMTTEQHEILEAFIVGNRKNCWESEFERGEYCLGEMKIVLFIQDIFNYPQNYGLMKKDFTPSNG